MHSGKSAKSEGEKKRNDHETWPVDNVSVYTVGRGEDKDKGKSLRTAKPERNRKQERNTFKIVLLHRQKY
jgi:hypothetical protein